MKRFSRMLGVTLLEIMLVLAIAAMVIVMSIRYYSSAQLSQQTNTVRAQIQALTAAMDNLAVGTGTYAGISSGMVTSVMGGAQNMTTPWGAKITIATPLQSTYAVTIPSTPPPICKALSAQLAGNPRFVSATCTGTNVTYTYDATK